jgi:hypothetical protein
MPPYTSIYTCIFEEKDHMGTWKKRREKEATYISLWDLRKPHPLAILDDRPTRAMQIHNHVLTAMHPELATRSHDDAVLDTRDMR